MPLTRPIKATAYFPSTFIDLELSGLTTSAGISSPHNEIAEVCDALDGGGFQCPISNFVLRHCCHRTLAEFVNNDGHKARFPCGVYHVKRVEEKWGKKGEKNSRKMHIAISGGKPTIPIFQYSDFRMCRTFLFILHRDWDNFDFVFAVFWYIFFERGSFKMNARKFFFFPSILLLFWLL